MAKKNKKKIKEKKIDYQHWKVMYYDLRNNHNQLKKYFKFITKDNINLRNEVKKLKGYPKC